MMKPYFKGKAASTKPMYSRNLIHPRVYENTPQLHSACGGGSTPQCLSCGIIVQVSCTMVFLCVWVLPFVWYNGIPQASPSEYHYTTLRVQYPYTLENHSTTITYIWHIIKDDTHEYTLNC